jgi:hypothetical protein
MASLYMLRVMSSQVGGRKAELEALQGHPRCGTQLQSQPPNSRQFGGKCLVRSPVQGISATGPPPQIRYKAMFSCEAVKLFLSSQCTNDLSSHGCGSIVD